MRNFWKEIDRKETQALIAAGLEKTLENHNPNHCMMISSEEIKAFGDAADARNASAWAKKNK